MKRFIISLVAFVALATTSFAQEDNMPKVDSSPLDMAYYQTKMDNKTMNYARVIYSRPQVKGREIFGKLVPYGKVWRTGANEATEVQFYQDVMIAGVTLEAGTYELFTVPGEKEWTIIFSNTSSSWGAYNYKEESDLAIKLSAPTRKTNTKFEYFSIYFTETDGPGQATMNMAWDNTLVSVPLKFEM